MGKKRNEIMKDRRGTTSKYNIINIENQNHNGSSLAINKDKSVGLATYNTRRQKKTIEFVKPSTRSLFESISLFKLTNMLWIIRINQPMRLFHVNFLYQNAMKEGIFDEQLSNRLIMSDQETQ